MFKFIMFTKTMKLKNILLALAISQSATSLFAQSKQAPKESDYYMVQDINPAKEIELEVGGIAAMPNGLLAVCTRKGDIYLINPGSIQENKASGIRHFASGMHEPLGIAWYKDHLIVVQRTGVTRVKDTDDDMVADRYEDICTLPLSGNYHEYAYGPAIDPKTGDMYVSTNVGFFNPEWWRGVAVVPWRGYVLKITQDGQITPIAAGVRSPCGIGMLNGNEVFYTENQGDWIGSGYITRVEKGDFHGQPGSLAWSHLPEAPVKMKISDLPETAALPRSEYRQKFPALRMPSVWLPHGILGTSNSGFIQLEDDAFGPYKGQVLVGDQGMSRITRVYFEKVNGVWQGAGFGFREGFNSGVLRLVKASDGAVYIGQTSRGWSSTGKSEYGLQRMFPTGKLPFEMQAISARPDGFEVFFTKPINREVAAKTESWSISSFTYKYHLKYGSPTINNKDLKIKFIKVSSDGMSARLVVDSLRQYYIHEVKAEGIRSQEENDPLLHNAGYYTLNELAEGEALEIPEWAKRAATKPASKPIETKASDKVAAPMDHSAHIAAAKKAEVKPALKATVEKPASDFWMPKKPYNKKQGLMPADWGGKADHTINMTTSPGMKFSPLVVEVKAGSKVKWLFTNPDDMTHNCVIVAPGMANKIGEASLKLGVKGEQFDYVPKSDAVYYHTGILQPETTEVIYFRAPGKPGKYTYVCTVPGHYMSMQGTLIVK